MLIGKNISFRYKNGKRFLLKNASIEIEKGKITFLEGPNGSGKTTLGLILSGAIPTLIPGDLYGAVIIDDKTKKKYELLTDKVGFLFQNPDNFFTATSPREEFNISIIKSKGATININDFIEYLGIENILDNPVTKLSYGQKQIIAIASLLILNPDYLILDEPFSNMDYEFQNKIIDFLNKVANELNKGLMIISHELIDNLKVDKYYRIDDGITHRVIRKNEYKYKDLKKIKRKRKKKIEYKNLILEAKEVAYKYKGTKKYAIEDINICIKEGECLGVTGPNGSGKSTFLLVTSCLLKRTKGNIFYFVDNMKKKKIRDYNIKNVAIVFQDPDYQLFGKTIKEEIEYAPRNLGFKKEEIEYLLKDFKKSWMNLDLNVDPFSLSFGQKKLLSIYSVLTIRPKVVMLDEPFLALDMKNKKIVINKINNLRKNKNTVIIVSHDEDMLNSICDRIIYFKKGRISKQKC